MSLNVNSSTLSMPYLEQSCDPEIISRIHDCHKNCSSDIVLSKTKRDFSTGSKLYVDGRKWLQVLLLLLFPGKAWEFSSRNLKSPKLVFALGSSFSIGAASSHLYGKWSKHGKFFQEFDVGKIVISCLHGKWFHVQTVYQSMGNFNKTNK